MIRCIVIDDEPLALKQLISYAEQTPELELVASCESAREALEVLRNEHIDANRTFRVTFNLSALSRKGLTLQRKAIHSEDIFRIFAPSFQMSMDIAAKLLLATSTI